MLNSYFTSTNFKIIGFTVAMGEEDVDLQYAIDSDTQPRLSTQTVAGVS